MTYRIVSDREVTLQMHIDVQGKALQKSMNEVIELRKQLAEAQVLSVATTVVASDVLKELLWIRAAFDKDPETGGVVLKNVHGKEISKWIDRVDALGDAA